jgi:hypothetical protein
MEFAMVKDWGVARFYGFGSMEYLLQTGAWLSDGRLFDGAPIRLFDSMADADAFAEQFPKDAQPHGVQFKVDAQGRVTTSKAAGAGSAKPASVLKSSGRVSRR